MFSVQHIIWLIISILGILCSLKLIKDKNLTINNVLTAGCIVSVFSEISKMVSVIELVPSANGTLLRPYIAVNHLPLHLCSLQILLIFYTRFTENKKMRENFLAFMYPSCIVGALAALLMPSIFTTTITPAQAFSHLIAYQFFIFHSMLIVLGITIARSGEIKWEKKHIYSCILIMLLLGFLSIYINSILASPTYVDGVLQHVDFWPNFMFTYDNPLGIPMTKLWHWYLYLAILVAIMVSMSFLFYLPLIKKNKNK